MGRQFITVVMFVELLCCCISLTQEATPQVADTSEGKQQIYDPFGPENSPDHNGQGSGGVLTPSPYENINQTYFTRISSDYHGIQYMLDCPFQVATGTGWTAYEEDIFGILFKVRGFVFRRTRYDPVVEDFVPYYLLPYEASFEYALNDKNLRAFKVRLHYESDTKSLGMAGIGMLVSDYNVMVARDLPMDRKWDVELTWRQVGGGYIMPLSPSSGGINIAIGGAVDLFGVKFQEYNSDKARFLGIKVGSIGWLAGFGWNAFSILNLSLYAGGEWSFSSGGFQELHGKTVRADISRNTLYFGLQGTGRYVNIVGGIQKEWEYLDFQKTVTSEKSVRTYLGASFYIR